jgi:acetylornithine deacetylase/succinyl-diaminopimelate desuccinylase-like protein
VPSVSVSNSVSLDHADNQAAPGSKTVIPCSVKGKFSIRLVPNLGIKNTTELVVKYVNEEFKKIGSKNRCEVYLTHGGEPWLTDPNVSISLLQLRMLVSHPGGIWHQYGV